MDSILLSIKKLLGIQPTYTNFDEDIIIHINTAFAALNQLGVGPSDGFLVENENVAWSDYITTYNLSMIRSYVYLKVRLLFDPPTSSVLIESINRTIDELEWRIFLEGDSSSDDYY